MSLEVQTVIDQAHDQPIICVALNKLRRELYSGSQDSLIKVWDTDTGKFVRTQKGHKGWVSDLLFVPYAKFLFSSSVDGNIVVWSDRGKELQTVDFGGAVFCMAWNPKRSTLAAGGNMMVQVYRMHRPDPYELNNAIKSTFSKSEGDSLKILKYVTHIQSHTDLVKGIVCAENGRIFSVGYDKAICVYDADKPKEESVRIEKCHDGAICSVAFDTDNNWLITGSYDGTVKIWSQEGRCLDVFDGLSDTVTGLAYIHSTKTYWITGKGRKIVAYDPRMPANISAFIKDTSRFDEFVIHKIHQVPLSDTVVGITVDRQLVVWKYNSCAAFRVLMGHRDWVEALTVVKRREDPNTIQVYSAGSDGLILRWTPTSALNSDMYECQEEFSGHEGTIQCVVYSEEMDILITGSEDLTIRIWSFGTPQVRSDKEENESIDLNILVGHEGRITGLACCSDQVLASASHDKTIRFWDLHTRHEIDVVERAHDTPIHSMEYCETREELATAASEPIVKIWDSFKHSLKVVLTGHQADITQVKWCAFKNCWATAADDQTIRLWDPDGLQKREIDFKGESITCMFIDNKHELILAAMLDRAIRAYETESGYLVRKYRGHTDIVRQLAMVEEKGQYLSCSWDKSIRVWFTPKGKGKEARDQDSNVFAELPLEDLEEDEEYISTYEREHPLVAPRALKVGGATSSYLKMTNVKAQPKPVTQQQVDLNKEPVCTTGLGKKLKELEDQMKKELLADGKGRHSGSPGKNPKGRGMLGVRAKR